MAGNPTGTRYAFGLSDVGRTRLANEDAFLIDNELGLYVVADGMGGHNAGEIASTEAVQSLHGMIKRQEASLQGLEDLSEDDTQGEVAVEPIRRTLRILESAVQAATYMVFGLGEANPERKGMGTTMSVLLLRGALAFTAQVGDSRVYLIREGKAEQVTEDHTLVAWQVKKGIISAAEARNSRQKNVITRAVGSREYVQVDTRSFPVRLNDRFLVCSDGLHSYIDEAEVAMLQEGDLQNCVEGVVKMANQRGGRDNITALLVALA